MPNKKTIIYKNTNKTAVKQRTFTQIDAHNDYCLPSLKASHTTSFRCTQTRFLDEQESTSVRPTSDETIAPKPSLGRPARRCMHRDPCRQGSIHRPKRVLYTPGAWWQEHHSNPPMPSNSYLVDVLPCRRPPPDHANKQGIGTGRRTL